MADVLSIPIDEIILCVCRSIKYIKGAITMKRTRTMLRFGALLLTAMLILGLSNMAAFAATARPLEGVTLTVWKPLWWIGKVTNDSENVAFQTIQERLGVKLVFENPPSGTEVESFNLMVAGDMLPDIIFTGWGGDSLYTGGVDKYISDGVLLNVKDMLAEYAPDYLNAIKTLVPEGEQKEFYTDEGNLALFYAISPYEEYAYNGILYRNDWMTELKLENPKTIAQMENVLTKFKEVKGAVAPMILPTNGLDNLGGAILSAWDIGPGFYLGNSKVEYGAVQPAFKEYLRLMADWYKKGLVDIDFATRNEDAWKRMITTGESGCIIHSPDTVGAWMSSITPMMGGHNPGLTEDQRIEYRLQTFRCRPPYSAAITTACKDVKAAMTFLNYGYTKEGYMLYNYGVEGETYNIVDGKVVYTDMMLHNPEYPVLDAILKFKAHIGPFVRFEHEGNPAITLDNMATRAFWTEDSGTALNLPMISLTAEEGEEFARIMTQVYTYQNTAVVNFIMGTKSLDEFDKYVEDMLSLGLNDVVGLEQAAYERYMNR
jgi:putative aldouronate transport system substrate-binding protein